MFSPDLAGSVGRPIPYLLARARINRIINRYLSVEILSERLSNVQEQFSHPLPRPWDSFHWSEIDRHQIIGVDPALFLKVVASAAEIEDPIRGYALESWHYLQPIHALMAEFVGGQVKADGSIDKVGVWEKEERQHGAVFRKIYQQLTGEKLTLKPNTVDGYQPSEDPIKDAHRHVISRITTEWGAASVYIWLVAHSTGDLQIAIAQPLQDEISHLAKFWGFSRWAFGDNFRQHFNGSVKNLVMLSQHHQAERTFGRQIVAETPRLGRYLTSVEMGFTLLRVMVRLNQWNRELSRSYLKHVFGRQDPGR